MAGWTDGWFNSCWATGGKKDVVLVVVGVCNKDDKDEARVTGDGVVVREIDVVVVIMMAISSLFLLKMAVLEMLTCFLQEETLMIFGWWKNEQNRGNEV
jgi:hypothetical protein